MTTLEGILAVVGIFMVLLQLITVIGLVPLYRAYSTLSTKIAVIETVICKNGLQGKVDSNRKRSRRNEKAIQKMVLYCMSQHPDKREVFEDMTDIDESED